MSRGAGITYQVAQTLSRFDRGKRVWISNNPFFGAGNESTALLFLSLFSCLSLPLLFHSNQLEKRRTLRLSSLRGIHGPLASISRGPPVAPLKYHVSYGHKKSWHIHIQIAILARYPLSFSLCLLLIRSCELREWLTLDRRYKMLIRARSS